MNMPLAFHVHGRSETDPNDEMCPVSISFDSRDTDSF